MINGCFISKRGKRYQYTIHNDNYIEVWIPAKVIHKPHTGGYMMGKEKFINATQEIIDYIMQKYNIKVWDYGKQGMKNR